MRWGQVHLRIFRVLEWCPEKENVSLRLPFTVYFFWKMLPEKDSGKTLGLFLSCNMWSQSYLQSGSLKCREWKSCISVKKTKTLPPGDQMYSTVKTVLPNSLAQRGPSYCPAEIFFNYTKSFHEQQTDQDPVILQIGSLGDSFLSLLLGFINLTKRSLPGTSLVIQWLRLCALNAGDPGSIPGQGIRSHMSQLKIPCATTKIWHSQINKQIF